MKLNSKTLKSLIIEVIEEMKRRDFLKGAAGLAGAAALGHSLYDDEDEEKPLSIKDKYKDAPMMTRQDAIDAGMNPDEFFPPEGQSYDDKEQFPLENPEESWKEKPTIYTKSEGKYALDKLRFTPEDLEFYGVAPSQDAFGDYMAYVDIGMVYDMADENPEIAEALVVSEGFYGDFTIKEQFKYVFGSKAFWGTYRDEDNPLSRKMMPSIRIKDNDGNPANLSILPVAWTVSLDHWTVRFENLMARLQQHPDKRKEILSEAGLTEQEYKQMKAKYNDVTNRMSKGAVVANPNYNPEEEQ